MLSKRLQMIYDLIPASKVVADIGTDHAYLPCELAIHDKAIKIYACDNKEGPLSQAKKNIEENQLEDKITCILSDGLKDVPEDVEIVIIAGMGLETACTILEEAKSRLASFDSIFVQVNKNVPNFRKWIAANKYRILEEKIVFDSFYYQVIQFKVGEETNYSMEDIYLGPCLMKEKSPTFLNFLKAELDKMNHILLYRKEEELLLKKKMIEDYIIEF